MPLYKYDQKRVEYNPHQLHKRVKKKLTCAHHVLYFDHK